MTPAPDIELSASVRARELTFRAEPVADVHFPGRGARVTAQRTVREGVDSPVHAGRTYHRVYAATRITARLVDDRSPGASV